MSEQDAAPPQPLSEEFFIRVNDFIERANRIERRYDTHRAELVFLHAFARYSAHHYLSIEKQDSETRRREFAAYIARGVDELVFGHIGHIGGEPKADPGAAGAASAGTGAEPAAE